MREKRMGSRYRRGYASIDAMFAVVPALLMLLFVAQASHFLISGAMERTHRQETFDKLVSIADYVVKQGAVKTDINGPGERHPNWLDSTKLTDALASDMRQKTGLGELTIALDSTLTEGFVCVYRIVAVDDAKEIRKLYVCGA